MFMPQIKMEVDIIFVSEIRKHVKFKLPVYILYRKYRLSIWVKVPTCSSK